MRATGASIAKTLVNLCLLLASCAAGLALSELSLRLFYPKYHNLAEAPFRRDASRIWSRMPNTRDLKLHPDTRLPHALHHNNFALRQHRNFSAADLASATNVGFFGDSFVENVRMDAPYSFTEPLDWLLNQGPRRFDVLNFGVEGYGPGQSFLLYEKFRYADDLDHVFFVYYSGNDLVNLNHNGLFDLDEAGRLVRNEARRSSRLIRFISELHVSYLVLDVIAHRFSVVDPESVVPGRRWRLRPDADDDRAAAILRRLMRHWKRAVEENGGRFITVLLPQSPVKPRIAALLEEEEIEVVDLYDCFRSHDGGHHRRRWKQSPYRFKQDDHWNETGNRLAAVCLYRFLEKEMRLPGVSEDALREALHRYYSAFGGWTPPGRPGRGGAPRTAASIREKYQALGELDLAEERADVRKLIQEPEKRVIRSHFDVYLDGKELVYVKYDCSEADAQAPFFLRTTPVSNRNFHYYYDHRAIMIDEKLCVAKKFLPDHPVARIVTGQFLEGATLGWQAEAVIDRDALGKALEKTRETLEKAVAPEKLVIHSDFDVYLDGKWLIYLKDACSPLDLHRRFFLHVIPADEGDLPEGREFDNQDFSQMGAHVSGFGCVVRRRLPDYAVRHVRTGQAARVEGRWKNFWEGEFSISPERQRRP